MLQMRHFILRVVVFLLFLFNSCFGQKAKSDLKNICKPEHVSPVKNKDFPYSIGLAACDTCIPISNKGYRVIPLLKDSDFKKLKSISRECWFQLLEDEKSDWAANLIPYALNDKDATAFLVYKKEKDWRKSLKKDDVEYWKKSLK